MIKKDIIKTLKINHYIKNSIVFVPLIFSKNFFNLELCFNEIIIFFALCFISSSVYIMNDLIDIEKDKNHPIKKNRPIASGRISVIQACIILIILFISSVVLAYFINKLCLLIVLLYFLINIFYSYWLKHIILIDATCIAIGFILRILAGCFAIKVLPSPLIILMTFFISNFFTYTKRKLELKLVNNHLTRKSLTEVNIEKISQLILINAILSISFYITYVLDINTIERVGSQYLYLTVLPFTLIIYRLFILVDSSDANDDPIIYIEQDKMLKYLFLCYILIFVIVYKIV